MQINTRFNIDDEVVVTSFGNQGERRGKVSSYEYDRNGLLVNVIVPSINGNEISPSIIKVPESFLS